MMNKISSPSSSIVSPPSSIHLILIAMIGGGPRPCHVFSLSIIPIPIPTIVVSLIPSTRIISILSPRAYFIIFTQVTLPTFGSINWISRLWFFIFSIPPSSRGKWLIQIRRLWCFLFGITPSGRCKRLIHIIRLRRCLFCITPSGVNG
ncbi:hypothetical protein Lalb_Chr20g0110311 [Lupinus albus]|uniref:Uncharacterized protein n=1 Tax=Lupinus albus TaxID=3870 RepID=A0A6A4NVM5_LUPAL|nr:hypothetical protein Lalb_Chr20g0110311 [Lupinus albus]